MWCLEVPFVSQGDARGMQVFHRMDSMLKDTNYTAELDALRRTPHDTASSEMQTGAQSHNEQGEEDGQVSTSEALDMLRQVGRCISAPGQRVRNIVSALMSVEWRVYVPVAVGQYAFAACVGEWAIS